MSVLALDRPSHRAAWSAAVALLLAVPFTFTRVPAVLLVLGLLPGLGVASRFPRDAALGVGVALSPVIFGIFMLFAMLTGIHANVAAWVGAGGGLAVFVALGGRVARGSDDEDRRALARVACVILAAALLAFALPVTDTWWRWREDSWFHAAVADKLMRDGLPLTDPYFAGMRLQYVYFYHAIIAGCAALASIDFFHAMILVNAVALASCGLAFHALSGLFSRRAGPRVLGLCVWLFAMNGWFFLFYPIRVVQAFAGRTHGVESLRRFFPWNPAGHDTAVRLISIEGNQFMFLDKFMIGTAFSLTFGLAASLLYLWLGARRGVWSRRHDAAFVLCIAGAILLHLVTGVTLAVVTTLVLAMLLLFRSQPSPGGPSYARLVGWIALGAAVAAPYVYSVLPRGESGGASLAFAFQPAYAMGLLADVLPALALAVVFFRRAGSHRDTPERLGARPFAEMSLTGAGMLAAWALLALAIALTADLTTNNETKFAFLVHLPLSALAVGAFERLWANPRGRRTALILVASATLPLHLLYFHHAVRDASSIAIGSQERAAYHWIERKVPRDAVFLEQNDVVRVPVLASRDLYWGNETYARNWGYPHDEMVNRRRLRDAVFSAEGPSAEDLARLRELGRPVFVIYRVKEDDLIDASERFDAHPDVFQGRFAAREIAVWELGQQ